jgi:hypothetical protein
MDEYLTWIDSLGWAEFPIEWYHKGLVAECQEEAKERAKLRASAFV